MFLLGLGSNLSSSFGDRFKNLDLAASFLETYKIIPVNLESYFRILTSVIEFQDLQEIILETTF